MSSPPYAEAEYAALRQTIATRGIFRMVLLPLVFLGWAALGTAALLWANLPIAACFPLAALAAGFEAVLAMHLGVERVGRYLQVFYEEAAHAGGSAVPRWETVAMAGAPALPGGGTDPLFTLLFALAALLNFIVGAVPGPSPVELGMLVALHFMFLSRILYARRAATSQRRKDLAHYRELRQRLAGETPVIG